MVPECISDILFEHLLFLRFSLPFVSTQLQPYVLVLGIRHDSHCTQAGDGPTSFEQRPLAAL